MLTKSVIVTNIAQNHGITKKEAESIVTEIFSGIADSTANDDGAMIAGFGSFKAVKRKAREGRNPKTGAVVQIAGRSVPKFRPAKAFKYAVNK